MLHRSFKPAKCKTALKLATSRIKLMKNKKENHYKQLKRELAQLLESGQDQTARIRVEHVVREEKTIAAYDLLDIYCELIVARLPIIDSQKNCPIDLKEAVTSVVFAAPRCADIPELQDVRKHFTAKYGKEFVTAALELRPECGVSRMLVEKLSANAPDGQTKLRILTAIAEEHNVEWDPKSFGAKESKPYDDLLKGPNTFDTASNVHSQPPIVQSPPPPPPNVHAPYQQNEPVNYQQNFHSQSSPSFASPNSAGSQSAPSSAPQHPLRPSGTENERTEIRHSHSRDENAFSMGRKNWNMEFKDATAAAQAAAESAERASMAARAAAELSTREKFTRQHSHESHKSNAEISRKNNGSPSGNFVKDTNYNSSQDRNQKPNMRSEKVDKYVHENHYDDDERHYKDDHGSAKRFSQSASSSSRTDSVPVKEKRPVDKFHEVDRYSEKSSFKEEVVKQETSASLSDTRINKQSSPEDRNSYYCSSSSDDEDDYIKSPSHQNVVFDDSKDPFDSYLSDNDIIKFDKQPQYDEQESSFYPDSISREKSNHFAENIDERSSWENTSGSFKQPLSASRVSAELFSPAQFDESPPKAPSSAHPDDLAPATFDNSSGPSSDSEDELETSSFRGKLDPAIRSYKETDLFRNSNDVSEDQGSKGSYFTEKNDLGSRRKQNLLHSSDDREHIETTHRLSPQSSRLSSVDKLKKAENFCTLVSTDTVKTEVFDQSSSESGMDLKFTTLTGGLRNKGYKAPPYIKSPSGGSLSSKRTTEDIPTYTQNAPGSPRVEGSSLSSRVGPKVEENLSSTTRFKKYDMGVDDIEEKPAQQNLQSKREHTKENSIPKTRVKNYDLGIDGSLSSKRTTEDIPTYTQNASGSPRVEGSSRVGPKVEENFSSTTRFKKYDMGVDDIEEKPAQQNLQSKREHTKENSIPKTRVKNYDLGIDGSSSSKRTTEDIPTYTQNASGSPRVEGSSRVGPKVKENLSSTTRFKKYDMGVDDIEEKPAQQNLQSKREHTKENSIPKTRVKNYDLGIDESEEVIPKPKLANKQERKEDYTKSKFSAPAGFFDSDENDSDEDLPKRPSTVKVRAESGFSRRTKANLDSETSFQTKTKRGSPASASSDSFSDNRSNDSQKHSITKPVSEEKQKPLKMEQSSSPLKTATSSSGEAPSRESSLKKASHVHPNLPDYDSFAAHFQSLRQNRN